ncbi:hypothetical protein ABZP36_023089 [Zizania latifolia]
MPIDSRVLLSAKQSTTAAKNEQHPHLFGGIPDPVEETRLWKEHWDQLEATMVLLEPDIVARTCTDWLKECCDEIFGVIAGGQRERGSVPFDTVAEVEGHVHFFLSIPVKMSTDKTLVVDCLRCGMQIFVVNDALEYLAKDLDIAENAILQGGHPFTCAIAQDVRTMITGRLLAGTWWRTMFGISVIPSILLALEMAVSPKSPRWLFQLKHLYGPQYANPKTEISLAETLKASSWLCPIALYERLL